MTQDMVEKYWELPPEQLLDYVVLYWEEDESLDISDALYRYFEEVRPREWVDVLGCIKNIYKRMFDETLNDGSALEAVVSACAAASSYGPWDAVAEAFGLESKYVELVFAEWYEYPGMKEHMNPPPPITWDEFMRRYAATKAEWEREDVK